MKNFILLALAGLALTTACKKDETTTPASSAKQVTGTLTGANAIPANSSTATGSITGTFDPISRMLNYTITFANLASPATSAHLHFGDAKHVNPTPVVPLVVPSPNVASGTITGSTPLTQPQADSLLSGHIYANIHDDKYKAGEIRTTVLVK